MDWERRKEPMKNRKKLFTSMAVVLALLMALTVDAWATGNTNEADLNLVLAPETQLDVYVDGTWSGELSDTYAYGDTATLAAPAPSGDKSFSHWTADGSIVSYANPLKLTMNAHTTLYAVYANSVTAKPAAGFTSITRTNDGKSISFQAIAYSNGGTIAEAGIVYSTTATGNNLKIDGTGVTKVAAVKSSDLSTTLPDSVLDANNCWMLQITPTDSSTVYHARAYVTVGSETTYGDVKDVKLSALQSGVSLTANLDGIDPQTEQDDLTDALADLASSMRTVTFDANGGTGTMAPQGVVSGTATKLNANTFTREGYTFTGWATKENGSVVYKDGDEATLAEDVTLYAQWKSNASPAPASPTTGPLTVTTEIGTITRVTVDGKTVNSKYYFVSGSNVVLSEEFMSTLAPGKHTIRLYDGKTSATATWTIEGTASAQQAKTAATGDAGVTHYGVLAAAAAAAICAVLACAWVARKRKAD